MTSYIETNRKRIEEINCDLVELIHKETGAQIMYLGTNDKENLFSLSFPTYLNSSNGIAHILEHTVLCGSKKFPIKDPFFGMKRRSLNTFMNAFTGADFTCYPAASQIKKDFYNLLDVYLDAVFHPNVHTLAFLQEGHRLEFEELENPESPLTIQGVVYNEMKGALASPDARMGDKINELLFPDLTYHYTLGGDPKEIPSLTHQQLINFHKKFYHPSRCLFFFYGDIPLQEHLDFLDQQIFCHDWKREEPISIGKQTRFKEPKEYVGSYPFTGKEEESSSMIAFSWLTCDLLDQEELLALSVLCSILLETDASLLKRPLIESKLAKQIIADLESDFSEVPLLLICKGCKKESKEPLEKLIHTTLQSIAKEGIPLHLVENVIHQIEFHRSEITGDHYPYGLSLFMRAGLIKQHGGDAEDALKIHKLCDKLQARLKKTPDLFSKMIEKYFLNNPHQAKVTLIPDSKLAEKERIEERARIDAIAKKLKEEEKKRIVQDALELKAYQESEDDEELLPKMELSDIPKECITYPLQKKTSGDWTIYSHDTFTNDIVYVDIVFDLPEIKEEEIPYLTLFQRLLTAVGANERNYLENLEYMQANTGGVSASFALNEQVDTPGKIAPTFILYGKALGRKKKELFTLLQEILTSPRFDEEERIRDVLHKHLTALESHLVQKGLKYALSLSTKGFGVGRKLSNLMSGLDYFHFIHELVTNLDERMPSLLKKLQEFKERILLGNRPDLILTCNKKLLDEIEAEHFFGLTDLKTEKRAAFNQDFSIEQVESQGRVIASPVAFTAMSIPSLNYNHSDSPYLSIASQLFDNIHLHQAIRERGGAYGGGAAMNPLSGHFSFYAYRDPNLSETLLAFKEAAQKVADGNFTEEDLNQAKLEIFQSLDNPISPGSRGHTGYFLLREGRTDEVRQKKRDALLSATKEQVANAVKNHLLPALQSATVISFAGKELLERENQKLPQPLSLLSV